MYTGICIDGPWDRQRVMSGQGLITLPVMKPEDRAAFSRSVVGLTQDEMFAAALEAAEPMKGSYLFINASATAPEVGLWLYNWDKFSDERSRNSYILERLLLAYAKGID